MSTPTMPAGQPPRPYAPIPRPPVAPPPRADEGFGGALFGGAVAALVGAGIWTLLVKLTDHEIGWVAWGVGALVGAVMAKMTPVRGSTIGVYAAVLAALGLATGKIMTVRAVGMPAAQEMMTGDSELLTQAFAWDMRQRENYSPEINQALVRLGDDTIPDGLWGRMLAEATVRRDAAPAEEQERVAKGYVTAVFGAVSFTEQFGASLSLFDFLWFFLAIGTAFKVMRGD